LACGKAAPPVGLRGAGAIAKTESTAALIHLLAHTADGVARELASKRHYVVSGLDGGGSGGGGDPDRSPLTFDPRFLIFEFISGFMLRRRQVELVRDFVRADGAGTSSVHQMIMGAGKTTCIGPLLGLMLADGRRLVTQVCPEPLLKMTRDVLRNLFTSVLQKRVYTLKFDRQGGHCKDVASLRALLKKLESARKQRAIVCTTPAAVKSIMLKYVDLLQQEEAAAPLYRLPAAKLAPQDQGTRAAARETRELGAMADELRSIMQLWSAEARGVALVDEVDLVLHPLRSELNFPIGPTEALALSPRRWTLPMHLLDAVFFHAEGRVSSPGFNPTDNSTHVLGRIAAALVRGVEVCAIQQTPHTVLLDASFYFAELLPPMADWALFWLVGQPEVADDVAKAVAGSKSGTAHAISAGIGGDDDDDDDDDDDGGGGGGDRDGDGGVPAGRRPMRSPSAGPAGPSGAGYTRKEVEQCLVHYIGAPRGGVGGERAEAELAVSTYFSKPSVQFLNLARDWLWTFLPHALSKVHRVGFGLLHTDDLDRWRDEAVASAGGDPAAADEFQVPRARKLLAVPFVGKDVPSRAAEFAHPEVLIGLSVLAYRCAPVTRHPSPVTRLFRGCSFSTLRVWPAATIHPSVVTLATACPIA
jgi:hypothetical protein